MSLMQGRGESKDGVAAGRVVRSGGVAGCLAGAALLLPGSAAAAETVLSDDTALPWIGVALVALVVGAVAGAARCGSGGCSPPLSTRCRSPAR